jgi:MYXO-CTERM domain-containing protein
MNHSYFRTSTVRTAASALVAMAGIAACTTSEAPSSEPTSTVSSAQFTNGGFETPANPPANTPPPAPWTTATHLNATGITIQTPQTIAGLNWSTGGAGKTYILHSATGPMTQTDPDLGATASLRWPRYGNQCAIVNQHGNGRNVNVLSQTMTIGAGDVDPSDGQIHIRFVVAPVLQNPAHTAAQQPYYMVVVTDTTKGSTLYTDFNLSGAGIPWKTINGGTANEIDYTDWQLVDIAPGASGIAMGDSVELQIIASGCQPSAHWGEIYVDGVGATVPGLSVQGTGTSQANAGSPITYTFTYRNGSAAQACTTSANCAPNTEACVGGFCAETNVQIDVSTPANTTFQSIVPPAGATCTTLAVGATGTITCTFTSPVSPGASGTFQLTVDVTTCPASGSISCSNYDIHSTQETTLLGTPINTACGCTADSQCLTGNWCNETADDCTPTLANGSPVPTDPKHTNPTLNGMCTAQAGTLTCTSGVCDTADNDCGYKNGDGPCSAGNATKVCRSSVCDPDLKCGYANGDGPCTPGPTGDGATICRSGFCGSNGLCEAPGACFVDSDCLSTQWCNETTHVCTPKETNGTQVPTDPTHTNPTLNGTCTASDGPVGPTVCVSGVCDANDGKCGYANGDGPCTPGPTGNGATVCRSGVCSANGTCEPLGGCNVDADCSGGTWCMESTHTCMAKLGNGVAMPTDPPHTSPTLNGTCTSAAGALVCASGVCDSDNKCGYLNDDGPCTAANGGVVCRSGVCDPDNLCGYANGDGPCLPGPTGNGGTVCRSTACSVNGTCEPLGGCDVDADCTAPNWCMESTHTCTAQLPNGVAVPTDPPHTNPTLNGMCTASAGTLVCTSSVCDTTDNECGYANGDGPCTVVNGGTVCRSGACSISGTCEPAGGCNVDADCTAGFWCNETMHSCTAQLSNGTQVPNDPSHSNPTLNGTCTAGDGPVGPTVCLSGVCDSTDGKCGYANGDGPCTAVNGGTVCRSGSCSTNGTCQPAGGCNVDADCTTGMWCDISINMCEMQLANGQAMPKDPGHTTPTLNGTCNPAAATLVCQSGVCDSDNECGYANGDGPCIAVSEAGAGNGATVCRSGVCDPDTKCGYANGDGPCTPGSEGGAGNGGVVCRSGMCSVNGDCEPAGGCNQDSDCTGGMWCNVGAHTCEAKLPNGTAVPNDPGHQNPTLNGTCTAAAGTLVCQSGVCDTNDNKCGYANGDGPCSASDGGASVCRSGMCSTNGTCEPMTGCNTNADCTNPALPVCDPTTHTCVAAMSDAGVDSGSMVVDSGSGVDATAPEGGTMDASVEDATTEDATTADGGSGPNNPGTVEGGGCATAPGPTRDSSAAAWLVAMGLAFGVRRRARRGVARSNASDGR